MVIRDPGPRSVQTPLTTLAVFCRGRVARGKPAEAGSKRQSDPHFVHGDRASSIDGRVNTEMYRCIRVISGTSTGRARLFYRRSRRPVVPRAAARAAPHRTRTAHRGPPRARRGARARAVPRRGPCADRLRHAVFAWVPPSPRVRCRDRRGRDLRLDLPVLSFDTFVDICIIRAVRLRTSRDRVCSVGRGGDYLSG
jgi:hypothetical protein